MKKKLSKKEIKLLKRWVKALDKGKPLKFKSYQERFLYVLWVKK